MKWIVEKDNELKSLIKDGFSYKEIAEKMDISIRSVTNRCNRLGIKSIRKNFYKNFICKNCGKDFVDLESIDRNFCNNSCSASYNNKGKIKSEITKFKISESLKNIPNNNKLPRTDCIECGKKVKKNKQKYCSLSCLKNSKIFKEKLSIIAKERYKKNPDQHPNKRCASIKETYPEKFFNEFLILKGLVNGEDFIKQFKVNNYYVDFFFPKLNLCVEIDGERWHDSNNEKEITRENIIKEKYKLIRFKVKPLLNKKYEIEVLDIINKIKNHKGLPLQGEGHAGG